MEVAPQVIPVVDFSGGYHDVVVNAWLDLFGKLGYPAVKAPGIRMIGQTDVIGYPDAMALLPTDGLTALEIKTGEDPPLTSNQAQYLPMLQLGGHIYSADDRIRELGLLPGVPFPPVTVYIIFANPGKEYEVLRLPPVKLMP